MVAPSTASAARHPAALGSAAIALRITPLSLAPAPACWSATITHDARRGGRAHARPARRSVGAWWVAMAPGARSKPAKPPSDGGLPRPAAGGGRDPPAGAESVAIVQAAAADTA